MSDATPPGPPGPLDLGELLIDVAGVAGAASITFGAWLIYHPGAFIVGGACLVVGAWLASRKAD